MTKKKEYTRLSKTQRYVLLKINTKTHDLKKFTNEIFSKEYKEPMKKESGIVFDKNDEETFFLSRWEDFSKAEHICINQKQFEYREATAVCEYSKKAYKDSKNNVLPKSERLNIQRTNVLFVNDHGNTYMIVYTFDIYDLKRIEKLANSGGQIVGDEKLESIHKIRSDMFIWLFYKYINGNSKIGKNIRIRNITGFTGNILSDENKFKGDSETTANLSITKAFLAYRYDITSLKIDVESVNGAATSFYIAENRFYKNLRVLVKSGSETNLQHINNNIYDIMPIYLYFYLIPEIKKNYDNQKVNFKKNKDAFLSDLGVEAIKRIKIINNIKNNQI
ncbi:hypothetical protein GYU96_02100 [Lactobacillus mellis]|uniref:hypothetical protein n=1 Tax=Bombilactobacillus mellis TaxID=1218508 RepID=UPI001580B420|nr:hypothetical protein [Bombilactobacillus mellis]NUG66648.1 hypothetical protein [Bombilactobacillus mellis]